MTRYRFDIDPVLGVDEMSLKHDGQRCRLLSWVDVDCAWVQFDDGIEMEASKYELTQVER